MNFTEAVSSFFNNYAVFEGRSSRSEYWYAYLFLFIVGFGLGFFEALFGLPPISLVFSLAVIVPGIAVGIRRMHDIGKSGWWVLLSFTIVGIIPVIYWLCQEGDEGDNQYGSNPLKSSA